MIWVQDAGGASKYLDGRRMAINDGNCVFRAEGAWTLLLGNRKPLKNFKQRVT